MQKPDKQVTIRMSQELYDTLKRLADEDSRSVPNLIRQILRKYVEKK